MARDGLHFAARTVLMCAGPAGGRISNQFNFKWIGTGTPDLAQWTALSTDVAGFYNTDVTSTGLAVAHFLGPQLSRAANASEVALYSLDMADPAHYYGSPVSVGTFTLAAGASGTHPLPNEVAVCMSFRADYGSDPEHGGSTRPRADDRGRVYIGPLHLVAIAEITLPSGQVIAQPLQQMNDTISGALTTLINTSFTHNWQLSVWSRKHGQFKPVVAKAINNEFDTMRRRQPAVTLQNWIPA